MTGRPVITPGDRFGLTLCLAIILHAIVILGVTFAPEDHLTPHYDTMQIVLVMQKQTSPNEEAKLLAQADLEGGGDTAAEVTPATPLPPPFPDNQVAVAAQPHSVPALPPEPVTELESKTETDVDAAQPRKKKQLVTDSISAETTVTETTAKVEKKLVKKKKTKRKIRTKPVKKPTPSATELLRNSFKIASLSAQIKLKLQKKAKRPRRTFISASTKSYKYAAYMEAWRAKVERVGNLNYPEEARKRKISGSLILEVALNPDGSVNQITIRRSSGHKVLDDAAIRIVRLASPYAPFPENIHRDTDILHITRTWQFLNNRGFR
ncbi:MAG: energy transducer TonB [Gammaproteobacteria bacterium]